MRGRSALIALLAATLAGGCDHTQLNEPPPMPEVRAALITAIRYPDGVDVADDVTVRFTVVINPCETLAYAEDHADGDAMRFSAWSTAAPCVSAVPTTQEVEFFLQGPQKLPRALIFDEPDDRDSVRVLRAKVVR